MTFIQQDEGLLKNYYIYILHTKIQILKKRKMEIRGTYSPRNNKNIVSNFKIYFFKIHPLKILKYELNTIVFQKYTKAQKLYFDESSSFNKTSDFEST